MDLQEKISEIQDSLGLTSKKMSELMEIGQQSFNEKKSKGKSVERKKFTEENYQNLLKNLPKIKKTLNSFSI